VLFKKYGRKKKQVYMGYINFCSSSVALILLVGYLYVYVVCLLVSHVCSGPTYSTEWM